MSLDSTTHLGSTGVDELVPSRYAQRVGDIEVLVISDGVLPITAETLAYNADSADLAAWLDDMFLPPDVLDWPLNVVVVRSGDRTVLVDAGLGAEFPDFPRAGQTARRLDAAGIVPGSAEREMAECLVLATEAEILVHEGDLLPREAGEHAFRIPRQVFLVGLLAVGKGCELEEGDLVPAGLS